MSVSTSILTSTSISRFSKNSNDAQNNLQSSIGRVSSGSRINSSSDDAAGLSLASRLQANQAGVQKGIENANMGITMLQTADGSLSEIANVIVRMRELAVQASSDVLGNNDRAQIDFEFQHLHSEIDRISDSSVYNKDINLLQSSDTSFDLQVGHLNNTDNQINIDMTELNTTTSTLNLTSVNSIATATQAQDSLAALDRALNSVNESRTYVGSFVRRLDTALANAQSLSMSMEVSQSRVLDLDFATESSEMTRFRIMHQSSIAALGQARAIHRTNLTNIFNQL